MAEKRFIGFRLDKVTAPLLDKLEYLNNQNRTDVLEMAIFNLFKAFDLIEPTNERT